MTEPVIEARALTRRFGDLIAVDALDLTVAPRTIYGFLGPNGCGKTTTLRMLTGLLTPSAGTVTVLGHRLPREAERLKRRIGYMTQRFSLYDDLSVAENLGFVAEIYGLGHRAARRRISALLATYTLEPLRDRRAGRMSGGQRQRLALAAATIHEPALLFLDEPTSAVDPENRRDFWERLFDLVDAGATILVSTHYMDEAERCHRLAIMASGHKRADGSPAELMAGMGARVVEVEAPDLRALKQQLSALPQIISAAQLGSRLRVLVADRIADPVAWLRAQPLQPTPTALESARPSSCVWAPVALPRRRCCWTSPPRETISPAWSCRADRRAQAGARLIGRYWARLRRLGGKQHTCSAPYRTRQTPASEPALRRITALE